MLTSEDIIKAKNRNQHKRWYERCKKDKVCANCGAPTDYNEKTRQNFTRCPECRAKAAEYWRRKRAEK